MKEIRSLIVRIAEGSSSWGYCRVQGELKKLGHRVACSTIAKTLKEHGVRPSPERPTGWNTLLRAHEEAIAATDFFTPEVWTARGLVTHYILFVIDHATRPSRRAHQSKLQWVPRCGHHHQPRLRVHGSGRAQPDRSL
jgi:hypothetical protein